MFTDPQIITVNSVAHTLPRVGIGSGPSATYRKSDQSYTLTISHRAAAKGRLNTMARIDFRKVVSDPLTAVNDYDILSWWTVLEHPEFGFTQTEAEQLVAAGKAWLTNTAIGQLWGGES